RRRRSGQDRRPRAGRRGPRCRGRRRERRLRVNTGFLDDLTSVTLVPDGRPGALIGGSDGLILTLQNGRWDVAQPADHFGPFDSPLFFDNASRIVGLALLPGDSRGAIEAWA